MLLKFLPNAKCLIDRFLLSQTTRVERSDSRPVKNQIRLGIKTQFHKRPRPDPITDAIFKSLYQCTNFKNVWKNFNSSIFKYFSH